MKCIRDRGSLLQLPALVRNHERERPLGFFPVPERRPRTTARSTTSYENPIEPITRVRRGERAGRICAIFRHFNKDFLAARPHAAAVRLGTFSCRLRRNNRRPPGPPRPRECQSRYVHFKIVWTALSVRGREAGRLSTPSISLEGIGRRKLTRASIFLSSFRGVGIPSSSLF